MRIHITYTGGTIGMIDSPERPDSGRRHSRMAVPSAGGRAHGREPVHVHRT